jgi:hypothetical protein
MHQSNKHALFLPAAAAADAAVLAGVHCLLAPGLMVSDAADSLGLLITAAGGNMLSSMQQLLQLAGEQQQQQLGGLPCPSPRQQQQQLELSNSQQQQQQQQQLGEPHCSCEHLLVLLSSEAEGKADVKVSSKDLSWARESGLPAGFKLYSREWLTRCILTYSVDWRHPCAEV